MPRVLIGDFGAIPRLGLRDFFLDEGIEVVGEGGSYAEIASRIEEVRADVVLLDLDAEDALDAAAGFALAFPAVKVIACSSEEPLMRVFPAYRGGDCYSEALSPLTLAEAVRCGG
jgi:DNA-binding NarL/FixJ family response regulator